MLDILTRFLRPNRDADEARRAALVEILRDGDIGESVRRRREGTTEPRTLMEHLQAGDQGDADYQLYCKRWEAKDAAGANMLARWGAMTPEAFVAMAKSDPQAIREQRSI